MEKESIREAIITGYRNTIKARYQFDRLRNAYDLPPEFTAEKVDLLRDFFLTYMYPEYERRQELDAAFLSLDEHLKHPDQVLRILIDSGKLIFIYGRHLPGVVRAGLKAVRSFRAATAFENHLEEIARRKEAKPPFGEEQMRSFLAELSPREIDNFIQDNLALFDTLHDRKLVKKIIDIVEYLIRTMKKHPDTYGKEEIKGLEWGQEIIVRGDKLFNELSEKEQQTLFEWTQKIELEFVTKITRA